VKEERNPSDCVRDILEAAEKVSQFIRGLTYEKFCGDEKTVFAVVRGLEIVGEAARNVTPALRDKYPGIPWRLMTGMRDRLIHDYGGVNLAIVWNAASKDLPDLEPKFRAMLNELGD
jgi:uncharacterized protein with HEPN domain